MKVGIKSLLMLQFLIAPAFLSALYASGFNGREGVTLHPLLALTVMVGMPAMYAFAFATLWQSRIRQTSLCRFIQKGVFYSVAFGLLMWGPIAVPALIHSASQSYVDAKSTLTSARNNGLGSLWVRILLDIFSMHLKDRLFNFTFLTIWYVSIGSAAGLLAFYWSRITRCLKTLRSQNKGMHTEPPIESHQM